MKQLIGLTLGFVIGLTCAGCVAQAYLTAEPMQIIMSDRGHINTTKIKTEEGTYRIFTIEHTDGKGGIGITAVKIK